MPIRELRRRVNESIKFSLSPVLSLEERNMKIEELLNYIHEREKIISKLKEKLKTSEGFAREKYLMDIEFLEKRIREAKEKLAKLRGK